MRRSGITSRAKCASFSISQTSCSRAGPRGPAVWMLRLSVTGVPDAWDSGGRLVSSLVELLVGVGRLATDWLLYCETLGIPATQTALRQRHSCLRNVVCRQNCVGKKPGAN